MGVLIVKMPPSLRKSCSVLPAFFSGFAGVVASVGVVASAGVVAFLVSGVLLLSSSVVDAIWRLVVDLVKNLATSRMVGGEERRLVDGIVVAAVRCVLIVLGAWNACVVDTCSTSSSNAAWRVATFILLGLVVL